MFPLIKLGSGDLIVDQILSHKSARKLPVQRIRQAKIDQATWHDFRRTAAGDLLEAGVDIATVADVGGWRSVQMVKEYDRRPDAAKHEALKTRYLRYQRRTLGGER